MFTVNDLIDIAVKMEQNGEALYLASRRKTQSPQLKSLLQWMANEEAAHSSWFSDKKGKWASEDDQTDLEAMLPDVIKEMMGDKTLSLDEVDFHRSIHRFPAGTFVTLNRHDPVLRISPGFIQDGRRLEGLKKSLTKKRNMWRNSRR